MALVLNEEQNMLKDAAKDFCTNGMPITQLRKLRDDEELSSSYTTDLGRDYDGR